MSQIRPDGPTWADVLMVVVAVSRGCSTAADVASTLAMTIPEARAALRVATGAGLVAPITLTLRPAGVALLEGTSRRLPRYGTREVRPGVVESAWPSEQAMSLALAVVALGGVDAAARHIGLGAERTAALVAELEALGIMRRGEIVTVEPREAA